MVEEERPRLCMGCKEKIVPSGDAVQIREMSGIGQLGTPEVVESVTRRIRWYHRKCAPPGAR